ncbi:hypothetical protein OUZ56_026478 [Daphnia magna]|uniref:HAT C-terminal dimerisation domain-containing protein n=1 Tax=Daphnia magna TaxID=35525 RepID=A0ABQ9ZLY3_9CRUS|nr:hypothetical protein OUZ56_026478 [Daphnia magna]
MYLEYHLVRTSLECPTALLRAVKTRVVNIGIGFDTDSSVASDTQYRYTIGASFKNRYRKTIGRKKIEVMIQADSKSVPGMENDVVDDDSPIDPKDFFSPLKSISNPQKRFSPADDEINRFFETKTCNDFRVLDSSFPYLRRLFIQLNTGLPSSAAVERLFSLGGRVFTPMRTQLSDQRFASKFLYFFSRTIVIGIGIDIADTSQNKDRTSKSDIGLSGGYKKDVLNIRPRHLSDIRRTALCYVGP